MHLLSFLSQLTLWVTQKQNDDNISLEKLHKWDWKALTEHKEPFNIFEVALDFIKISSSKI